MIVEIREKDVGPNMVRKMLVGGLAAAGIAAASIAAAGTAAAANDWSVVGFYKSYNVCLEAGKQKIPQGWDYSCVRNPEGTNPNGQWELWKGHKN